MLKHCLAIIITLNFFYIPLTVSASDALNIFKSEKGTVRIAGGTAHIPVMEEAAKRIMTFNNAIQITVAGGGSGVGIKQVGEGLVSIGNSGRKPTDDEIARYNLTLFKWAIDGIGIIVNPENGISELTETQTKKIFAGEITDWKELGGSDHKITVYTRDESSGTRAVFWKKALGKGAITGKADFVASNGAMKVAVSKDPYGIGYVSVGHIDETVKPVKFNGVAPTVENVVAGKYTIARGLYSNTRGKPEDLVKKCIDYLYSAETHTVITEKGFIPVDR